MNTESTASTAATLASSSDSRADKPASDASSTVATEQRSSWRENRNAENRAAANDSRSDSARSSSNSGASNRDSTATGDNASLVSQLNEAARELATLRVANARLKAERERPAAATRPAETAPRLDPAEQKIAASLKSYAALKQELASFLAEIDRGRAENAAASAKLKDAVSRSDEARAAVTKFEAELRAEKRARAEAEQTAAKLQEQLRTIAKALLNAGINVDKLAAGAEASTRRDAR